MYRSKRQHPFLPLTSTLTTALTSPYRSHQPPFRLRLRHALRSRSARYILVLLVASLIEILLHVHSLRPVTPARPIDAPFQTQCVAPRPDAPRENAVVVMLARNSDVHSAVRTIQSFEQRFNRWYHYPYVFFNDEPWDLSFEEGVRAAVSGNATFEVLGDADWGWPPGMSEMDRQAARRKMKGDGLGLYSGREGYHHMCRFFAGKFYDHPAVKPYRWYWRLDSDVEFLCSMPYDPFTAMRTSGKKYGYAIALWEIGSTAPTLFEAVEEYRQTLPSPKNQRSNLYLALMEASWAPWPLRKLFRWMNGRNKNGDVWTFCHFWSNFEIVDLEWFRSAEYKAFFEYLENKGGMYFERWGDAPIHSLAAALLLEPREVHYFNDYGYQHDGLQRCPDNAPGGQLPMEIMLGGGSYDEVSDGGVGCRCSCSGEAAWLKPTCQNEINRAVGGPKQVVRGI